MKKFIFALAALLISGSTFAGFEFETMRTPDVPGFFMVRIFPEFDAEPLTFQNVFVKNYPENEAEKYESLFPIIEQAGGTLVERTELAQNLLRTDNRIIILGKAIPNKISFQITNPETATEDFQNFLQTSLKPVYLQNLETKFGGNVSEVYANSKDIVGEMPIIIVGKFETERRTRMEISGITAEGEMRLSATLDLDDPLLSRPVVAQDIPQVWEEFFQNTQNSQLAGKKSILSHWHNLFPIALGMLGILFFIIAFRSAKKNYKKVGTFVDLDESIPLATPPVQKERPQAPSKPPFELEHSHDEPLY